MRQMGDVALMKVKRNRHRVLVISPKWKIQLGRPRLRWRIILSRNLSNKMGGVEWINLAQDRYKKKAVLRAGNLLLAEKLLDSENVLCPMELVSSP